MMTVSAFADEISSNLDEQVHVLEAEGITHVELRSVWDKNVLTLTEDELSRIRNTFAEHGVSVSAIASPIGKISITDDFEPHLAAFDRAIFCARFFGAEYIRLFSFYIPESHVPSEYRNEVIRRMRALCARADGAGVTLVLENEKGIYGDTPERCVDVLDACQASHLRFAYDPANFVQCGVAPFENGYLHLEPYLAYVHIKDANASDGREVPAGEGNAQIQPLLHRLRDTNYLGVLALEPHLAYSGAFAGFAGPELFHTAAQALKRLLKETEIDWR